MSDTTHPTGTRPSPVDVADSDGQPADAHAERDVRRVLADREELTRRIASAIPEDGHAEPLEGLSLHRFSRASELMHIVVEPSLCVIAQGTKLVHLGESRYRYDPHHYLLVTAQLPMIGEIVEASHGEPFLSMVLALNSSLVSSVMVEAGHTTHESHSSVRACDVSPLSGDLLDAAVRLLRLLDAPEEAPVLKPMIVREIVFRLLKGEQGRRLQHIAVLGGSDYPIAQAVRRLHEGFDQSIPAQALAEEIGMSTSSFYEHFKGVTGMTPLQFQKQLQLQEARRLMLSENLGASTAGYQVGYDNAAQFSREYKRLFGQPPMRDVKRLRGTASAPEAGAVA